jgi:hypothetical protein
MAISRFGFRTGELPACWLMIATGGFGMLCTITGRWEAFYAAVAARVGIQVRFPDIEPFWLICQSALIIVGGLSAMCTFSFILAAAGVAAALAFKTPVGLISFLPGVWLLIQLAPRFLVFPEFTPRWRGPGPPPPGHWR